MSELKYNISNGPSGHPSIAEPKIKIAWSDVNDIRDVLSSPNLSAVEGLTLCSVGAASYS